MIEESVYYTVSSKTNLTLARAGSKGQGPVTISRQPLAPLGEVSLLFGALFPSQGTQLWAITRLQVWKVPPTHQDGGSGSVWLVR